MPRTSGCRTTKSPGTITAISAVSTVSTSNRACGSTSISSRSTWISCRPCSPVQSRRSIPRRNHTANNIICTTTNQSHPIRRHTNRIGNRSRRCIVSRNGQILQPKIILSIDINSNQSRCRSNPIPWISSSSSSVNYSCRCQCPIRTRLCPIRQISTLKRNARSQQYRRINIILPHLHLDNAFPTKHLRQSTQQICRIVSRSISSTSRRHKDIHTSRISRSGIAIDSGTSRSDTTIQFHFHSISLRTGRRHRNRVSACPCRTSTCCPGHIRSGSRVHTKRY